MTSLTPAAAILRNSTHVLLDFDGPITHMFADGRNNSVADRIRSALPASVELPERYCDTPDPLLILRWTSRTLSRHDADAIERACIEGELAAVGRANQPKAPSNYSTT